MTLSDLLFVALVLASAGVLLIAGFSLMRGRFRRALSLLGGLALGLTLYVGLIVAVSLLASPRELAFGENRCFDDWCIAVEDVSRTSSATGATYTATLRLSNRARRVSQRENGIVVFLQDASGWRFSAAADPAAAPFSILLEPGQSLTTRRVFEVSNASMPLFLAIAHEGDARFPGTFIIGDDSSIAHPPTLVRLP
jgi:hypothetical protein